MKERLDNEGGQAISKQCGDGNRLSGQQPGIDANGVYRTWYTEQESRERLKEHNLDDKAPDVSVNVFL